MNAAELLDRHYLEVRARLLEIAATLDRIDRGEGGEGGTEQDARMKQIHAGIQILLDASDDESGGRAEKIQHLFSLAYQSDWRKLLDV